MNTISWSYLLVLEWLKPVQTSKISSLQLSHPVEECPEVKTDRLYVDHLSPRRIFTSPAQLST